MNLRFEEPLPISKDEAELRLASQDADPVSETLIRIALWEKDWVWAEQKFLKYLRDPHKEVRAAALISIGHLARLHHTLHLEVVLPAIRELLSDADSHGTAQDALDDIACFIPDQKQSS